MEAGDEHGITGAVPRPDLELAVRLFAGQRIGEGGELGVILPPRLCQLVGKLVGKKDAFDLHVYMKANEPKVYPKNTPMMKISMP